MRNLRQEDRLFLSAEEDAKDFSLFHEVSGEPRIVIEGLLSEAEIQAQLRHLRALEIDAYISETILPSEAPKRYSAKKVAHDLGVHILKEESDGPYYSALTEIEFPDGPREVGIISQDRSVNNGVWMPEHHRKAAAAVSNFVRRAIPIVTLMDTPGANAENEANRQNQAHSISRLIAEMCSAGVPTVGIVLGLGYSGGAIPLATSNVVLSVRDGVFNTIQPRALASIARKYNLSWQECAKRVGISPFELYQQGNIDGIVDYTPNATGAGAGKIENLRAAIISCICSVERLALDVVRKNQDIITHYQSRLQRFLHPSHTQQALNSALAEPANQSTPTEFANIFSIAYQYSRYLNIRKRIRSTTTKKYGRLAAEEIPHGSGSAQMEREHQRRLLSWIQSPDPVSYDKTLLGAWEIFQKRQDEQDDERGPLAQFIFGEPKQEYAKASAQLVQKISLYLYNLWKGSACYNFASLAEKLHNPEDLSHLLRASDVLAPGALRDTLLATNKAHLLLLWNNLSEECRALLQKSPGGQKGEQILRGILALDLNVLIDDGFFFRDEFLSLAELSEKTRALLHNQSRRTHCGRLLLQDIFPGLVTDPDTALVPTSSDAEAARKVTVLDIVRHPALRAQFVDEFDCLRIFDAHYGQIVAHLEGIAEEASKSQAVSGEFIDKMLASASASAATTLIAPDGRTHTGEEHNMTAPEEVAARFRDWLERLAQGPDIESFLRSVEEWKKAEFPYLSDTLLVIVTFLLERLIPHRFASKRSGKKFEGQINPRKIGNRKDFWNQLAMAYRDLLIQKLLRQAKRNSPLPPNLFIERFFTGFEPLGENLITADPLSFPGYRLAIEEALRTPVTPCGLVTGVGFFQSENGAVKMGVAISNTRFQAGAFDMASAEKFCSLLVECARERMPLVCFISSGGMQTKEGAGALYSMAAVNDRLTRFVRDHDLPVIVFGFGDCTGGAQASFVTHPLTQTYYFSGATMPFAGQIVVPSHLSADTSVSNYLSLNPESMQGLVQHPFYPDLDAQLRKIDDAIPVPTEAVETVIENVIAGRFSRGDRPSAPTPQQDQGPIVRDIHRILIHARGCTAVKLIRVAERRKLDLILVQSDPDMDSVASTLASASGQVICIGGYTPDESYLNGLSVVRVAEQTQSDALHPGIGFLSENSEFALLCHSHDINFVGPPVSCMEVMGNKSNAISTATEAGVPVVPGSKGILTSTEKAAVVAQEIGYPVLIKAVHGGGGKGIKQVRRPQDLNNLFHLVSEEARGAFGNGDVYLEKHVQSLRHIEVQTLRDSHGNTLIAGFRDCTVQREKQKVFEESDVPTLSRSRLEQLAKYARKISDHIGYMGVGTVEFLHDLQEDSIYFIEMNTRLQVEHPVTEAVSGIDLVGAQLDIASGKSIAELQPGHNGSAIEARITAEEAFIDPDGAVAFRPCPGLVETCDIPEDPEIEVISAVAAGKTVPPYYDSLIIQIIAHGKNRKGAIKKLRDFLDAVTITGISTNIPLLRRILADKVFLKGKGYDTNYLPEFLTRCDADALVREMSSQGNSEGYRLEDFRISGSAELRVPAPSTGIFHLAPAPDEPPFVTEGDLVKTDQTLCLIEAMKIFSPFRLAIFNDSDNPIYPEDQLYRIKRIQNPTGSQVNSGNLLFVIEPTGSKEEEEGKNPASSEESE